MNTAPSELTEDQIKDFQTILTDIRGGWAEVKSLPATVKSLEDDNTQLRDDLTDVRRSLLSHSALRTPHSAFQRSPGCVSDDCARRIAATFIHHCARSGALDALASQSAQRDALISFARQSLGISTRTALTTSDIPLPSEYTGELRELISDFGVVRRRMSPYPIGMGTSRPARMGTRPAFGSIAMSVAFGEKSPTITFASLESHKIGGIVRLPREIDEQSVVAMGQFLARYGAVEFARAEDTAILDGYPIVWTDVLQPYTTSATADSPIAVFGALSFWWLGEHGSPRLDTSEHVYFANDQLAARFIEEIDFDYAAADATAALITAAS